MKIADLPKEAKPREKALCFGIESLENHEILALLIGSGVKGHSAIEIAKSLLETFITLPFLANASIESLKKQKGLNKISALKLLAAFELHKRLLSQQNASDFPIVSSQQIFERFRYLEDYDYEVLILVMLNRKKEIVRERRKYHGTFESCSFDFKEIIGDLLDAKCSYFILVHNHPDGAKFPSQNDVISTVIIKDRLDEFGIKLLDHVIIYKNGYYSFFDHGHFKTK